MPTLSFQAVARHTGKPVELEIFLANHQNGYTSLEAGHFLKFEHASQEPLAWFAMFRNIRVAHGEHLAGKLILDVDESSGLAEIREVPADTE